MSRHLIANLIHGHPDAATVVGWDPELRTYFCDIEHPGGVRIPFTGRAEREVTSADALAAILAQTGIRLPSVLVAKLRLELLAASSVNAPQLDWRSGEPVPLT